MIGYVMQSLNSDTLDSRTVDEMAGLFESDFVPTHIRDASPEFYSRERFNRRMYDDYMLTPGFETVLIRKGTDLVGFVTAAHLTGTGWWDPLVTGRGDLDMTEDGTRTLAIFDLLVAEDHRGKRLASLLHAGVLAGRDVERISLLSSAPQQPAFSMFQRWKYEIVGRVQFEKSGPQFDLFLKPNRPTT